MSTNGDIWYTNGSKDEKLAGTTGVHWSREGKGIIILLGILTPAYLAIQVGSCRNVHICTDSREALRALQTMMAKLKLTLKSHNTSKNVAEERCVELV